MFRMGFEILSRKNHQKHFFAGFLFPCFLRVPVFISVLLVRGIIWRGAPAQRNAAMCTPQRIHQRALRSVFRHLAYSGRNLLLIASQSTYYTETYKRTRYVRPVIHRPVCP